MLSQKVRILLLAVALFVWFLNGLYAIYVNKLRLEQYKLVRELRKIRKENDRLYWKISQTLNFKSGLEFAQKTGMVEVKPYRVANFYPFLKGKPLIDFYYAWKGDTPYKIAQKLGVPLKVLIRYNPALRWGYVVPMQRIIYPVSFPVVENGNETSKGSKGTKQKKVSKETQKLPQN